MRTPRNLFYECVLATIISQEKESGSGIKEIREDIFDRLIIQASHNRVLYLWASNLVNSSNQLFALNDNQKQKIDKIVANGNNRLDKLQKTLIFIKKSLEEKKIPFLVVKTFRSVPYITFDVDLLVTPENFEETKLAIKNGGCQIQKHPGESVRKQVNCVKDGLLKIDLHQGFYWQGFRYMDDQFIWNSSQYKEIQGVTVPIPRLEVELALEIIHTLYERRYVTLLDMLLLRYLHREGLNFGLVKEQAAKYGWCKSMHKFMESANFLNGLICPEEKSISLFQEEETSNFTFLKRYSLGKIKWPYFIPSPYVFSFFGEMIQSSGRIPWFDIAYYFFATGRWYLRGKKQLPFYSHWYE